MKFQRMGHKLGRFLTTAAALFVALGLALPQSAMASAVQAKPRVSLVGFDSTLEINGQPYSISQSGSITPKAFPPTGFHTFTRAVPYWSFADSNGDGYQQVSYATNTEQWGYTLSAAVQRIVVGNVSENADLYHGSTRTNFGAHVVPADYFFHGSSGSVSHSGTYATTILITFRCNVGANCTGSVSAQWNWIYGSN
jgi:hypothetical protein